MTRSSRWDGCFVRRCWCRARGGRRRGLGEPVPMIQAVTDGFCDQGLPGDCMVGVTTVVFERGVGVVIVVTLPLPWMACLRVYALVV